MAEKYLNMSVITINNCHGLGETLDKVVMEVLSEVMTFSNNSNHFNRALLHAKHYSECFTYTFNLILMTTEWNRYYYSFSQLKKLGCTAVTCPRSQSQSVNLNPESMPLTVLLCCLKTLADTRRTSRSQACGRGRGGGDSLRRGKSKGKDPEVVKDLVFPKKRGHYD